MSNNPFMPVTFRPGPPTTMVWEDGPGPYVNPSNTGAPVRYNGQDQVARINAANPISPANNQGWCVLPGAATGYSKIP
jgi:hypothetical protein